MALWLVIAAGLGLVLGANAHLVYVAESSQPACVAHLRSGARRDGFSAAQSACPPRNRVAQSAK